MVKGAEPPLQAADLVARDPFLDGGREPFGVDHEVWTPVVLAYCWIERVGDVERVMDGCDPLVCTGQRLLAFMPMSRADGLPKDWLKLVPT